jgi:hypothetical protein
MEVELRWSGGDGTVAEAELQALPAMVPAAVEVISACGTRLLIRRPASFL